jgi:hypothetical protein
MSSHTLRQPLFIRQATESILIYTTLDTFFEKASVDILSR